MQHSPGVWGKDGTTRGRRMRDGEVSGIPSLILIYLSRLLSMQRRAGNSHDHLPLSPSLPLREEGGKEKGANAQVYENVILTP